MCGWNGKAASRSSMRLFRLRCCAFLGVVIVMVICLQCMFTGSIGKWSPYNLEEEEEVLTCRHPELEMMSPLIKKHIKDLGTFQCNRENNWVETRKGTAYINRKAIQLHGSITCKLNYIKRVDDFKTKLGKAGFLASNQSHIVLEEDFFLVSCEAEDKKKWHNLMSGIYRNESLVRKLKSTSPPKGSTQLNILMYGLDSMSRMHFMRKLPKTYDYLKNVLKTSVLTGYNIVGDGTPQALIPILTGQTEDELPETRKRMKGAQFVDIYPFAWKNFSASGYATAWAEEQPHVGTFTYRLKGFKDLPTDHCMRSFFLKATQVSGKHPYLCLGNKPRHTIMLDWLRDFYETYHDVPKFGFCFNSELSHDDYNLIGHADPDIEKFLKDLHEGGFLDNTLLIVFSDHGHRFAPIRASLQGKQEERLPFFSITLPPWMKSKYPEFARNLQINENRLVTPFDIYSTLMAILNPKIPQIGKVNERSISLFSEIPKERTCSSASIEPHWCTCLTWFRMSESGSEAHEVGGAVIEFVNKLTEFQRDKCERLVLSQVSRLEKLKPNKRLLTFKKNADYDGRFGEFSDNTKVTEIFYQIQIHASPSNAIYEAIVKQNTVDGSLSIKESELSRINMYGDQEHCIHEDYPNLRKYCYCTVQLAKTNLENT